MLFPRVGRCLCARDINTSRKARDVQMGKRSIEPNASASAMIDLTDARINFVDQDSE